MTGFSDGDPPAIERFRRLKDLPPSAKLVYTVLDGASPLTQAQLRERTLLPERTVRHALGELRDAGIVVASVKLDDSRRRVYSVRSVERPEEGPE